MLDLASSKSHAIDWARRCYRLFDESLDEYYLGRASVAHTYGAAGSLMVVLLWLYFSAQMFLFGAEFTQVYARHFEASRGRR